MVGLDLDLDLVICYWWFCLVGGEACYNGVWLSVVALWLCVLLVLSLLIVLFILFSLRGLSFLILGFGSKLLLGVWFVLLFSVGAVAVLCGFLCYLCRVVFVGG